MSSVDRGTSSELPSIFRCPVTGSRLHLEGSNLLADDSGLRYPVRGGIPSFLSGEPIEDDETYQRLIELNRIALEDGWRRALDEVYGPDADIVRYVTDESRADFLDLLELNENCSVLEIGPGLGQFSPIIARRVRHLYALEVVEGQAHFAATRCEQQDVHNSTFACGGDDCKLPFPDECMDVVLLNLVLEWCSTRDNEESAEIGQRRLIAEMYRVLKPGGWLYLSTKNRFALRYLLGKQDEHSFGMRFGNAMPRWLHNLALRFRGHTRPAGLLHSHNSLRSMLTDAGYGTVRSFWAAPEMRHPKHFVPTHAAEIQAARLRPDFEQGELRSTSAIMPWMPSSIVKHFTPGLTFIARKA